MHYAFCIPHSALCIQHYAFFDLVDDVADVGVGNPRTSREADADFEEGFRDAVDVGGGVAIDGLFVHRFPQGARFDAGCVESHAECLDVVVGLAVGRGTLRRV